MNYGYMAIDYTAIHSILLISYCRGMKLKWMFQSSGQKSSLPDVCDIKIRNI